MKQIPNTKHVYYCDENGNIYDKSKKLKDVEFDHHGFLITEIDGKIEQVHKLVALTYVSNPRNHSCINHINGNITDNSVNNLEWVSSKDESLKQFRDNVKIHTVSADDYPVKVSHNETAVIYRSLSEAKHNVEELSECLSVDEKTQIGAYSVEKTYLSPVYNVIPVPIEQVHANSYNPNAVAGPEFELLYRSIKEDGYTQPVVCFKREDGEYEIVDGFHRYSIMKAYTDIYEREHGLLPIVVINKDLSNRMASTIRHNRARGSHSIELMSNIVAELVQSGMSDAWILKNIGMDKEELLRLKQITGLASLFKDRQFSESWNPKS